MEDLFLILALVALFVFLYFVMRRIDFALGTMRRKKVARSVFARTEPFCLLLPDQLDEQELLERFREYRRTHQNARIVFYDADHLYLSDKER